MGNPPPSQFGRRAFLRFEQGRIDSIDRHFDRKPRVSCHEAGVGYGIICPTSLFVLLID